MTRLDMFSSKSGRGRAVLAGLVVALGVTVGQAHAAQGGAPKLAPTATPVPPTATPVSVPAPSTIAGWAVVQPNGALARGRNVTASGQVATGAYRVLFNSTVAGCSYQATIGLAMPGFPPPGEISVAPLPGNPNAVGVATYDSAGNLVNLPFHLLVVC